MWRCSGADGGVVVMVVLVVLARWWRCWRHALLVRLVGTALLRPFATAKERQKKLTSQEAKMLSLKEKNEQSFLLMCWYGRGWYQLDPGNMSMLA